MNAEIEKVGSVNVEELRKVLEEAEANPGGYAPIRVRVYADGGGAITCMDVFARVVFANAADLGGSDRPGRKEGR
jgi:hypothetical protein